MPIQCVSFIGGLSASSNIMDGRLMGKVVELVSADKLMATGSFD